MPTDKSPGHDGYTVEFLREAWSIVKADFITAVQSFFVYGFIPKGINTTILALIPKKKIVTEMKDYRPISCCNVIYKVISKLLANRLKQLLPEFISLNQSAFVKDCLLMENVFLASEIVKDYHKESISPQSAIKIDISKAFDSVQWPFLLSTLSAMNLPKRFIKWIELCISTASFSVQIFDHFAEFSGLKISLEKSTLYMAGVRESDKEDILRCFTFALGSLPVRYLGLPLLRKRMTTSDYALLLEIRDRIGSWTARHLSFAERLQLISSVIHSLTNFWMSAFRLPKACIREIDSLCSAFLWSSPDLNRKKAKVSWADVCTPKEEGGLGLRSLAEVNTVVLTHRTRRHRSDHLNQMENLLGEIRSKGLRDTTDVVLWKGKRGLFKASFNTKEVWQAIRSVQPSKEWHRGIWFTHATPKYSFLAWLAIHNRLTTGDRMLSWNVYVRLPWKHGTTSTSVVRIHVKYDLA
ncbi:PREDICTED: uncharacterized protein LOC104789158 [Camelina sativa]|uniref:Uncharacterized protein LOC104789158 n=1 Tax=Camelina sativa TaxID=90675 RepID=A0ABM0ZBD4_CAMSA|nr:PREDICTED: uncharacterized protein LOC104789158 [Camelina sativa]